MPRHQKKVQMATAAVPVAVPSVGTSGGGKKRRSGGGSGKGKGGGISVGARIGGKIGSWVGDMAQKAIATVTGFGDYEVKENSIVSKLGGSQSVPMFLSAGGSTRITHREYVGNVQSTGGGFSITSFLINPANSSLFPWLSEISYSYETFRVRGMVIEFVSTYGDAVASTNAAVGSVILATQYNAAAPPFQSQSQMENYEFATSTKPSVSMIHPVECDPSQLVAPHLYVYPGASSDPRWSCHGTVYLATVGQQAAGNLGELWVSYDIELFQPKLLSTVSSSGLGIHYYFRHTAPSAYGPQAMLTGISQCQANATGLNPGYAGDLLLVYPVSDASIFALPAGLAGNFMMKYTADLKANTGTTLPTVSGSSPIVTNGSGNSAMYNRAGNSTSGLNSTTWQLNFAQSGDTTVTSIEITLFFTAAPASPSLGTVVNLAPILSSGFGGTGASYLNVHLYVIATPF